MTPRTPRAWHDFSTQDIKDALFSTSDKSAPGPDRIGWAIWKHLAQTDSALAGITKVVKHIITTGNWPDALKESLTIVIPKPKRQDYSVPKNYRPIALINTIAKLTTKVLAEKMQKDALQNNVLHPFQMGGIQKRSCIDAGACLAHKVVQARESGLFTSALAVDIAQFFPSIQHHILLTILTYQGFPQFVVQCIENWIKARRTIYAMGAARSDAFQLWIGVPQGDPLSPLLSALYIAPTLFKLFAQTFNEATACIFYVDDGVILHSSPSMQLNMHYLRTKYQELATDFLAIGLRLEPGKTELMHFAAHLITKPGKPLYSGPYPDMDLGVQPFTGDKRLKPSLLWRYLGFFFDPKLTFSSHVIFYVNKAYSTIRALRMLGNSVKGLDCQSRALVFKAAVMPVLSYGAGLYWRHKGLGVKGLLNNLKKVQSYSARWIINAFRTMPGGAASVLAGLPPLAAALDKLVDSTYRRWHSLPPNHGISLILANTKMEFINSVRYPTMLVQTKRGFHPTPALPKKPAKGHRNASPILRAGVEEWKSDFPVEWDQKMYVEFPPNVTWRDRQWHRRVEDIGIAIQNENRERDVYVVLVAVDQRRKKNPRGHRILAKLGAGDDAEVFHFPLPFRLHFEATVHAITNAVEIIANKSTRSATLYTVHHFAFKHAFLPSYTEYGRDARASAQQLATWPHQLDCAWLPAKVDWAVVPFLKKQLKHMRTNQDFLKSAPYFKSFIQRRFDERWEEEFETMNKGTQWLKVRFGHSFARPGRRFRNQFYPYMPTPRRAAQLTYAITGHAPIGSYQKRFKIRQDDKCPTCERPQTRNHVLHACKRYSSISFDSLATQPDSILLLADFLRIHPQAFSFAHAPYDPP